MTEVKNNTVITLTETPEGVRVDVKDAHAPDHAIYILTQAIQTIIVNVRQQANEEVATDDVSELPTADGSQEEVIVSTVQE